MFPVYSATCCRCVNSRSSTELIVDAPDIARLVPLSTCLTHSSAECSLPYQGRTEAQETTRRSEHLAAHHERTSLLIGKNTTNWEEINVSTVFLCFETGKAKVKVCPLAASFGAVGCEFLCCLKGSQQCVSQHGHGARFTAPLATRLLLTLFF